MWLLLALIIGSATGIAAGLWLRSTYELLIVPIFAGIIGAILGLGISYLIHPSEAASIIDPFALLCELIGALLLVLAVIGVQRLIARHSSSYDIE